MTRSALAAELAKAMERANSWRWNDAEMKNAEASPSIQKVKDRLAKHPVVQFEADGSRITVYPSDTSGFEVSLLVSDPGYSVFFDGWHENFSCEPEALDCLAFGLSQACRLRVEYRGKTPYRWTLEAFENGQWRTDSTVGLLVFPYWRRRRVEYRQNSIIPVTPEP